MYVVPIEERTDLDGNVYDTKNAMLKAIGMDKSDYNRQRRAGSTHYEILMRKRRKSKSKRTKEKEYCESLGISYNTFLSRKHKLNWDEKDLFIPIGTHGNCKHGKVNNIELRTDHLGQVFDTTKQMCEHWDVPYRRFLKRIELGYDIEKALTYDNRQGNACDIYERTDHNGVIYDSKTTMCKHYNMSNKCYDDRIKKGWNKQKALENPSCKNLRNLFPTIKINNKIAFETETQIYYTCQCKKCNERFIANAKVLKLHANNHDCFSKIITNKVKG